MNQIHEGLSNTQIDRYANRAVDIGYNWYKHDVVELESMPSNKAAVDNIKIRAEDITAICERAHDKEGFLDGKTTLVVKSCTIKGDFLFSSMYKCNIIFIDCNFTEFARIINVDECQIKLRFIRPTGYIYVTGSAIDQILVQDSSLRMHIQDVRINLFSYHGLDGKSLLMVESSILRQATIAWTLFDICRSVVDAYTLPIKVSDQKTLTGRGTALIASAGGVNRIISSTINYVPQTRIKLERCQFTSSVFVDKSKRQESKDQGEKNETNWELVESLSSMTVLKRATYLSLLLVPVAATAWAITSDFFEFAIQILVNGQTHIISQNASDLTYPSFDRIYLPWIFVFLFLSSLFFLIGNTITEIGGSPYRRYLNSKHDEQSRITTDSTFEYDKSNAVAIIQAYRSSRSERIYQQFFKVGENQYWISLEPDADSMLERNPLDELSYNRLRELTEVANDLKRTQAVTANPKSAQAAITFFQISAVCVMSTLIHATNRVLVSSEFQNPIVSSQLVTLLTLVLITVLFFRFYIKQIASMLSMSRKSNDKKSDSKDSKYNDITLGLLKSDEEARTTELRKSGVKGGIIHYSKLDPGITEFQAQEIDWDSESTVR